MTMGCRQPPSHHDPSGRTTTGDTLASQWLSGTIRHRRQAPVHHQFQYQTGMLALDLEDWYRMPGLSPWMSLERFNWLTLKRADYFQPGQPDLRGAVAEQVRQATGWVADGPIQLITHPRYLGYVFNPVSFYFCYGADQDPARGDVPRVILAQITNTPWHERHVYCLECDRVDGSPAGWRTVRFDFRKRFHVSPFNPMDQIYHWTFNFRGPELRIHMNVIDEGGSQRKAFDATLLVQRTPLTRKVVHGSLRRFPLEAFKVVLGIYWHVLKLKLKGAIFHGHPDKLPEPHPNRGLGRDDDGLDVSINKHESYSGRVSSWRS